MEIQQDPHFICSNSNIQIEDYGPVHAIWKRYKFGFVKSVEPDQPVHKHSLMKIFTVLILFTKA